MYTHLIFAPFGTYSYTSILTPTTSYTIVSVPALHLGYSKCILVSHDWGAAIAWDFSIYFPSMVERMVVVSAPPMSVFQGMLGYA